MRLAHDSPVLAMMAPDDLEVALARFLFWLAVSLLMCTPAFAIEDGHVDESGAFKSVYYTEANGLKLRWYCSAVAIAPTLLVTSAHCIIQPKGLDRAQNIKIRSSADGPILAEGVTTKVSSTYIKYAMKHDNRIIKLHDVAFVTTDRALTPVRSIFDLIDQKAIARRMRGARNTIDVETTQQYYAAIEDNFGPRMVDGGVVMVGYGSTNCIVSDSGEDCKNDRGVRRLAKSRIRHDGSCDKLLGDDVSKLRLAYWCVLPVANPGDSGGGIFMLDKSSKPILLGVLSSGGLLGTLAPNILTAVLLKEEAMQGVDVTNIGFKSAREFPELDLDRACPDMKAYRREMCQEQEKIDVESAKVVWRRRTPAVRNRCFDEASHVPNTSPGYFSYKKLRNCLETDPARSTIKQSGRGASR